MFFGCFRRYKRDTHHEEINQTLFKIQYQVVKVIHTLHKVTVVFSADKVGL